MSVNEAVADQAVAHFKNGFNCAQSVLLALYLHMDEGENLLVPKIAAGFGGGIGRCGSVCGALTGAIMAVGIKDAPNEPGVEKRAKAYADAKTLYKKFQEQNSTVFCKELIKLDLSNPADAAKAREEGTFRKVCDNLIRASVKNFLELESK